MNVNRNDVTNTQTWVAASWIFSDEESFREWTEFANNMIGNYKLIPDDESTIEKLSTAMMNHYLTKADREVTSANMFNDMLCYGLHAVNWKEVAKLVIDSRTISDDA